ncbi:MAG: arginine--tRNA ligase [candidate division SR1 bacterium]|nr:arginine--tRNA ligase [candidate division SR1 bacterium]
MIGTYKQYFAEEIAKHIDLALADILLLIEIPPENIPGDLAFPCFQLAKQAKTNPNVVAQQLADKFSSSFFETFSVVGGYVNAHIKKKDFINAFFTGVTRSTLNVKRKEKILIEYMSANPNKPLHIGQARNVCVGDSVRRIYEHLGYTPTTCDYGDDSGVNIGYNIVGHLYYDIPVTTDKKFDHYCGEIYEKMRGLEEDPVFVKRLTETLLKIEDDSDPEINKLHQKYTQDCTHEQMVSCWRMGAYFDLVAWETHILHLKFFASAMDILKEKGFVKYADDGDAKGCRILDLSSLPAYAKEEKQYQIMIKSDGLATYVGKDIALAMWKLGYMDKDFGYEQSREDPRGIRMYTTSTDTSKGTKHDFGNYDEAVTVIDYRQIPPQQIVASVLQLLGHVHGEKKYLPLGYGIVFLTPKTLLNMKFKLSEEEKLEKRLPFASRKGRTVTIDDMLDMLHKKAYMETKERNPERDDAWLDKVAEAMAISALRFFLIRGDIMKDIVFDLDEVMDMQGETGAYILYTGARMQSIIDGAGTLDMSKVNYSLLQEEDEFSLIKKMSSLEETILKAKEDLAPHHIAKYCFDLAQLANSYYAHTKILVDDDMMKIARIALLQKVLKTLQEAMNLIGMIFVERM